MQAKYAHAITIVCFRQNQGLIGLFIWKMFFFSGRTYTKWAKSDEDLVKEHFHEIITQKVCKTIPSK